MFSYAAPGSRHVYIQGTAIQQQQLSFFLENFTLEAGATGYIPERNKADAAYTFKFDVARNMITYDDGSQEPAPPDEPQFIIQISLVRNADDFEMVSFGFPFTELESMLEYTQYLFLRAAVNIPVKIVELEADGEEAGPDDGKGRLAAKAIGGGGALEDDTWRNKWLYARVSLDMPVIFYKLLPEGLYKNASYAGKDPEKSSWYAHMDNQVNFQPAATLGVEVQVLDFLSLEPKIQVGIETLHDIQFASATAGLDIMFPLKKIIPNVMVNPYLTAAYPLDFFIPIEPANAKVEETIFKQRPLLGVGGGLQVGIKNLKSNAIFIDIGYTVFIIGKTEIYNNYNEFRPQNAKINPETIFYERSVLNLGIGYKFGFIDRKKPAATPKK